MKDWHYRSPLCHELKVGSVYDIPGYSSWVEMRRRCSASNRRDFKNYGGRGITVCDRWHSFENFYRDMGPRPGPAYSIDRIDVDGNYEPGNCRWATRQRQDWNKRNNRYVIYRGNRMCLREAIRRAGDVVRTSTVIKRLQFHWPVERAVETPPDPNKPGFTKAKRQARAADHHTIVFPPR